MLRLYKRSGGADDGRLGPTQATRVVALLDVRLHHPLTWLPLNN